MTLHEEELRLIEETLETTSSERRALYKWVEDGHSPYENPFGFYDAEKCCKVNFVKGLRLEREIRKFGRDRFYDSFRNAEYAVLSSGISENSNDYFVERGAGFSAPAGTAGAA